MTSNPISNVTLSGGDPFYQPREVSELARELKRLGKNIWSYTGYTYEEILHGDDEDMKDLLYHIDILVDGRFELDKKDLTLEFRGSSNQRIIDVQRSLQEQEIILWRDGLYK